MQHGRRRIAVVGGGVSGLGAAWTLRGEHDVTLFESEGRLGGHANTVEVDDAGSRVAIDTGFIVHNRRTYPELLALFDELDVPTQATEMSLSVECMECGVQYAGRRPQSLLIGVLRRPRLLPLLLQIRRMLRAAAADLAAGIDEDLSLEQWARGHGFGDRVVSHFLLPLTAAVWSSPPGRALAMPAAYILGFLDNHGMLGGEQVEWRTIVGGSREYVRRMERTMRAEGVQIRCSAAVEAITRTGATVELTLRGGSTETFDAVVLATHADHSLAMLSDADELERELLEPWRYTTNSIQLHDDVAMLPTQRSARAAWNYRLHACNGHSKHPDVSYYMNRLQHLDTRGHWSVSLNAEAQVDQTRVAYEHTYRHPRFSASAVRAQARMGELDARAGSSRTAFCGAWRGFGFHEDGLRSGIEAGRVVAASLRGAPELHA